MQKALDRTRSTDWQVRVGAVRELALFPARSDVHSRLIALLDDDTDLAVIVAAAEVLLIQQDTCGAARVLAIVRDGPDDAVFAISDRLLALLHDQPDLAGWLHDQGAAGALDREAVSTVLESTGIDPRRSRRGSADAGRWRQLESPSRDTILCPRGDLR
ncbi:hypothetical protein [Pseudonocardia lacus]|uniref:hypothetical protein n=1 Tax=Pseudonocardia lacus TaxID=2835865 RepID=UPI001BDDAF57|nr:hypothetical protein [Pseudonocardia lacus]